MVRHHMGEVKRHGKHKTGVRNTVLWKYVCILFTVVFLLVFYLWEQYQIVAFDSRIRRLRSEIETVRDENSRLFVHVVSLSNGREVAERAEHDLNMIYPGVEPILFIERTPAYRGVKRSGQSIDRTVARVRESL